MTITRQVLQDILNERVLPEMDDEDRATDWRSYYRGQHDLIMDLLGRLPS